MAESKPLTQAELEAIRSRCKLATPGPWETFQGDPDNPADYDGPYPHWRGVMTVDGETIVEKCGGEGYTDSILNADFIAHAREDIPRLLATIEHLQRERDALREALRVARQYFPYGVGRLAVCGNCRKCGAATPHFEAELCRFCVAEMIDTALAGAQPREED